jgi:acylphosphatase
LLSGPRDKVETMIEACRRGPPAARVDRIEISDDPSFLETGFHQLPTL